MSKAALLVNGESSSDAEYRAEANIDMVSVNDLNSKDSGQGLLNYSCEFDHIYASNMAEEDKQKSLNAEIALLKKIILKQVDFIQHQSLQLVTKDKRINALLEENETPILESGYVVRLQYGLRKETQSLKYFHHNLKSRLVRMDRRVTIQKQKDAAESNLPMAHSTPSATVASLRHTSSGSPLVATQVLTTLNSSVLKTGNDAISTPCPARRRKRDDNGSICSAASKRTNRSSSLNGVLDRDDSLSASTAAARINGKSAKRDSSQRTKRKRRLKNDETRREQNKDILLTNFQYYTTVGNEEENTLDLIDVPKVNGIELEVPCWRQRLFSSCYTMEGTENLSDDVFHKRHARLEIDERRRKRWDVQRIREQRQLEKLKQRERRNNAAEDSEELNSLWPTSDDVGAVDISPMLPVAAFGYNIPKFPDSKPIEFSLPWIGSEKTLNNTNSRLRHNSAKRASTETRNIFERSILVDQKKKRKVNLD